MPKINGLVVIAALAGFTGGLFVARDIVPKKIEIAASQEPRVAFNQNALEASWANDLNLNNAIEVFAFVFAHLPDRVKIYPTENYYYFSFYEAGQLINGNIRLDVADREQGQINFGYFATHNFPERGEDLDYLSEYMELNESHGVALRKIDGLTYEAEFQGKKVTFELNDLSQRAPLDLALRPGEKFMARTFDESGWQLVLIFDELRPQFRFVLDEGAKRPDILTQIAPRMWSGRLSGFVFYEDDLGRKVLFGVDEKNIRRNNYYDGPFDQLADNFVAGNELMEAMNAAYPHTRGKINQWGVFLDENGAAQNSRLAITPYHAYNSLVELQQFAASCSGAEEETMIRCLTYDYKQDSIASR